MILLVLTLLLTMWLSSPCPQKNKRDVWEYLTEPGNHVVLYTPVLTCYNAEGETVDSAKGGSRVCQTDGVWQGKADGRPVADPRPSRTVQTLRYEIYWRMVLDYQPHSWILLVDVRDTVFQTNPFAPLPRALEASSSGRLYFFGENIEATRLGKSKQNRKWLQVSYGDRVADLLADKPTVCSGATLGEQVALEMYIRAMVAESDDTVCCLVSFKTKLCPVAHPPFSFSLEIRVLSSWGPIKVFTITCTIVTSWPMQTRFTASSFLTKATVLSITWVL